MVVLPAASRPTIRMRISCLPKRPDSSFEMDMPMMRRRGGGVEVEVCFGVAGFASGMEDLGVDSRLELVLERDDLAVLVAFGLSF